MFTSFREKQEQYTPPPPPERSSNGTGHIIFLEDGDTLPPKLDEIVTIPVLTPTITSLSCNSISYNPSPLINSIYNGTAIVPYTGGNGLAYSAESNILSTTVLGLTASLQAGTLANGNGNLTYTVTGTPTTSGNANFAISFGGQSCTISITVAPQQSQVTIGTQIWTTSNLDVTTYRDGTPIPQVTDTTQWTNLTTGAWCYYNNDSANNVYGKLYNWYAAVGIYDAASLANPALRKILAPVGYHIPTKAEWQTLCDFVGGNSSPLLAVSAGGTNTTGFSAIYPGYRVENGTFIKLGVWTEWWGSTEDTIDPMILANNVYIDNGFPIINDVWYKIDGSSIRCIKD
jgi:uncharacterized protein (TIGR02145 family)